jgi:septum site-determining protein MinC
MRVIDSQEPPSPPATAFEIRRRSFDALVLRLLADDQAFFAALEDKLRQAPNFFRDAAVVLDLAEVAAANIGIDLIRVARQLRTRSLTPVGVQNGNAALVAAAKGAGLAILDAGREAGPEAENASEPEPESAGSMLITEPVRSGQQVFCDHGDIVVTASVGSGAELIAAGNIHVYGALRGRALAGVNGDARARVFCHSLEAELVAIAGLYRVSDDIDRAVWRRPVQAFLEKDALRIEPQK